jgi:hypothetical protein
MMRRLSAIQLSAAVLVFCAIAPAPMAQTRTVQPQTAGQPVHQRQGFLDYALGKINPSNTDYGTAMANGRSDLVGHTIDDLYFWSNGVTLGLLVCAAGIIYFEWRSAAKKEIVAATIIAELWNGRVSDKIEIVRRTQQFNQLVELQNQETERLLSAGPKTSEHEQDAAESITKNGQNGYSGSSAAGSAAKSTSPAPRATESAAVGNANDGTARLQQSNLMLQRRVEALENSEKNLKQRLNQTTILLDEERRRNATLKGA